MKIIHLFNNFSPKRKCGAEVGAAAVAGGAGLFGSILSSSSSSDNADRQLAMQVRENQKTRDWNTEEAEKQRQFAAGQTLQQNQFAREIMNEQMGLQAKYNSPVYQSQELQKANINPNVYFGQQSSFSGSSGSPSVPSPGSGAVASGSMGLSPVSFQPFGTSIGSIISSLGSVMKDSAEAKKLGIESEWLPKELAQRVRLAITQGDLNMMLKVGQEINNQLQNAKLPYAFKMAAAELEKALVDVDFTKQSTLTSESQSKVNAAIEKVQNSIKSLTDKQVEKLGLEMPYYVGVLKSLISSNFASAEESRASAGLKFSEKAAQDMANEVREHGLDWEKYYILKDWVTKAHISDAERAEAHKKLRRLMTVAEDEASDDNLRKLDAYLQEVFSIIGLHTSVSLSK